MKESQIEIKSAIDHPTAVELLSNLLNAKIFISFEHTPLLITFLSIQIKPTYFNFTNTELKYEIPKSARHYGYVMILSQLSTLLKQELDLQLVYSTDRVGEEFKRTVADKQDVAWQKHEFCIREPIYHRLIEKRDEYIKLIPILIAVFPKNINSVIISYMANLNYFFTKPEIDSITSDFIKPVISKPNSLLFPALPSETPPPGNSNKKRKASEREQSDPFSKVHS